ncbi:leucine-rich repeat domain-containing protein, partial [Adlercreutzia sp. ZJ154]|uniref:leucine-rich repeat domain-containing protein n=1 Tax=Adlercreutzia sp. ZJ154 TaxID=2709790 RepID=UPI00197FC6DA
AEGAFWGNESLATIVSDGKVKAIEAGVSSQIEGTYDIYPAFAPAVVKSATVALRVSADEHDAAKAAWEAVGFCNFADPATPGQVESPEENESGFIFTLQDDYTLAVGWAGDPTLAPAELVIPEIGTVGGAEYKVAAIAPEGFKGATNVVTVETPDSVLTIGESAFEGCSNLKTANLAETTQTISARAFADTGLTTFVLPFDLQQLDDQALSGIHDTNIVDRTGTATIAPTVLSDATYVQVYAPYSESGSYSWKLGLPISGNVLRPFGVRLGQDSISMKVGETVSLFDNGGYLHATGLAYPICTYSARYFSIDANAGTITAIGDGSIRFKISIAMDIEQARADGAAEQRTIVLIAP